MCPIFENQQRPIHHLGFVGGNGEHINRFVKARVGVEVRPPTHTQRLDEREHVLFGKMSCAVKGHVLHQMGQPLLVIVL